MTCLYSVSVTMSKYSRNYSSEVSSLFDTDLHYVLDYVIVYTTTLRRKSQFFFSFIHTTPSLSLSVRPVLSLNHFMYYTYVHVHTREHTSYVY